MEDETRRPPYSKAENKEESWRILRCILSSSSNVISTDIYVSPEPTEEGGIKQSSCRRFSHLPPGYPLQPQLFGRHRCITLSVSTPFISSPTGPHFLMADGCPTKAWGSRTLPIQFGNRRFQFSFLLANVDRPILGADFLAEFDLLEDASKQQVLERSPCPLQSCQPPILPLLQFLNLPLMFPPF